MSTNARRRIALLLLSCSIGSLLACGQDEAPAGEAARSRPNVILLVIDTLRADHVHGYGYPRETTPHLDELIREGARFETAIAPSSWSPPSHVTILTGTNPYRHEVLTFGFTIPDGIDPVTVPLAAQGYATGMFSTHLALHGSVGRIKEGIDHHFVDRSSDEKVLRAAFDWARSVEEPYFLYIVLTAPHAPYDRHPPAYDEQFFLDDPPNADKVYPFKPEEWVGEGGIPTSVRMGEENTVGFYVNQYDREIRYVDQLIGDFRRDMAEAGLLDDTLTIVTSDHGEALGDHDAFAHELYLYDFVVHVPLIVHHPGVVPAGLVWPTQVPLADVAPTILGFAGVAVPDTLDGLDLSSALSAGSVDAEPRLVTGSYRYRGYDRYMVRSDSHKLLYDAKADRYELYDLRADPAEQDDLLADPARTPAEHRLLDAALDIHLGRHGKIPADREPEPFAPEVLHELRALGYVGDE